MFSNYKILFARVLVDFLPAFKLFSLKVVGDMMTEERLHNIKKAFLGGDTSYNRLDGVQPAFADWHLVKTLYEVYQYIIKLDSAGWRCFHLLLPILFCLGTW